MQALAYENEFPTRGSKFCFFIGNPKMIGQLSLGIELTQRYLGRRKQNFFFADIAFTISKLNGYFRNQYWPNHISE